MKIDVDPSGAPSREDALHVFASKHLELFDEAHLQRSFAIGPIASGACAVVHAETNVPQTMNILGVRMATGIETARFKRHLNGSDPCRLNRGDRGAAHAEPTARLQIRGLTDEDFARSICGSVRQRLMRGDLWRSDFMALKRFVGLSQTEFCQALGITVELLRKWKQAKRAPDGPALVLLRIAAKYPQILHERMRAGELGGVD